MNRKTKQSNKPVKDNLTGWGIKSDEIPKMVSIGNVIVLLNKLYYKSILSVKDKKNNNIHGFPTLKVSEPFVNIIMKLKFHQKIFRPNSLYYRLLC